MTKKPKPTKKSRNRRTTMSADHLADFKFMLTAMRDHRNDLIRRGNFDWEKAFNSAEAMAAFVLGDEYTTWYK